MNSFGNISNIIIAGNWAAGKTQFIVRLRNYVDGEKGINSIHLDSDRFHFEDVVFRDTQNGTVNSDGSITGPHSILVKRAERGHTIFRALDGNLFNEEHKQMVIALKDTRPGEVRIVEYATGPNTSFQKGEVLDQSGHLIVETLIKSGALRSTLLLELSAPYELRHDRNLKRWDPVDETAFERYGQSGGQISKLDELRMRGHLIRINNKKMGLDELVRHMFYRNIQSRLMREFAPNDVEGGLASTRNRERR